MQNGICIEGENIKTLNRFEIINMCMPFTKYFHLKQLVPLLSQALFEISLPWFFSIVLYADTIEDHLWKIYVFNLCPGLQVPVSLSKYYNKRNKTWRVINNLFILLVFHLTGKCLIEIASANFAPNRSKKLKVLSICRDFTQLFRCFTQNVLQTKWRVPILEAIIMFSNRFQDILCRINDIAWPLENLSHLIY